MSQQTKSRVRVLMKEHRLTYQQALDMLLRERTGEEPSQTAGAVEILMGQEFTNHVGGVVELRGAVVANFVPDEETP
jgi:hypothetical protein